MAVGIHLPCASEQQIQDLTRAVGRSLKSIDISRLREGTILRLTTISGNHYFLQIIDPANCTVHLYRKERRGPAPDGYRGIRRMPTTLEIGKHLIYWDESGTPRGTSQLTDIVWLLDLEN